MEHAQNVRYTDYVENHRPIVSFSLANYYALLRDLFLAHYASLYHDGCFHYWKYVIYRNRFIEVTHR